MKRAAGVAGIPPSHLFPVLALALFLIFSGTPTPGRAADGPIRIATGEWPPYTSENIENFGVAAEIVTRTFEEMGVAIELVFYPWARCYESVRSGKVWGAFPFARTEARAEAVDFSDTILYSASKLFYFDKPPKGLRFTTAADLAPFRIGGVGGYYYESLLEAAGIDGDYAPKPENGLEKLMRGRTDLFIANELVGWYLIRRIFPEKAHRFGTLSKPLDRHGLRMIVSRRHPDAGPLLAAFNAALTAVKDDLFYRAILKKLQDGGRPDGP